MTGIDTLRLQTLAAEIDAEIGGVSSRGELIKRLKREQGLRITFSSGTYTARMAGISATNTMADWAALQNWGNAARRAILKSSDNLERTDD